MTDIKNPAAVDGGAFGTVLACRLNNQKVSTANVPVQRHRAPPFHSWTVDGNLMVEVRHGQ